MSSSSTSKGAIVIIFPTLVSLKKFRTTGVALTLGSAIGLTGCVDVFTHTLASPANVRPHYSGPPPVRGPGGWGGGGWSISKNIFRSTSVAGEKVVEFFSRSSKSACRLLDATRRLLNDCTTTLEGYLYCSVECLALSSDWAV